MILFNSWQSDISLNRKVINKSLGEIEQTIDIIIESATRNAKGSPDIANAILNKIDSSDIFLADVSIINPTISSGRKTPNPNVLYELGYALKSLGEDNIILIANKDTTETSDLPFDIRNRRMVLVSFSEKGVNKVINRAITDAVMNSRPKANLPEVPKIIFAEPRVKWANWGVNPGGVFCGFRAVISVDNYRGESDYILNVEFSGTDEDGNSWITSDYLIEGSQMNKLFAVPPDTMMELSIFMSDSPNSPRRMPNLDMDSGKITISFKSGKTEVLEIRPGNLIQD